MMVPRTWFPPFAAGRRRIVAARIVVRGTARAPILIAALSAAILAALGASDIAAAQSPAGPAASPPAASSSAVTPGNDPSALPAAAAPGPSDAMPGETQATEPRRAAENAARSKGAPSTLPHNLSPWGMFMNADFIVQAVMVGLAFASVITWTVWLAKSLELLAATRSGSRTLGRVSAAPSLSHALDSLGSSRSTVASLVVAAADEAEISAGLEKEGVKERVASRLDRIEAAAARRMTRGTGLLATIGATAPFVGLFGTVWGIMNSFINISKSQTTSLAVVAPGIAEALLATAIGLVAAIPAVVIYNLFARWISAHRAMLADASAEVMRHLSRDLDRARRPLLRAAE